MATSTTRRTSTSKAPADAKKPQDHKVSLEEQDRFTAEEVDGWELLRSPRKVKGSDQLRLMAALQDLGVADRKEGEEVEMDLNKVADFVDFVADRFANDVEEFEEWSSGEGGYERAIELAVAYGGALGESVRSAN